MSHAATRWCIHHVKMEDPTARYVLYMLADHSNNEGREAYPSINFLVKATSLSRRAIQLALRRLETWRIIEREERCRPNGSDTSAKFHLKIDQTWVIDGEGARGAPRGAQELHEEGVCAAPPEPKLNRKKDSKSPDGSVVTLKTRKPNGQHDYGETFEQLWIAYGRYGNKKPAAQEFNALSPELQAEVIAAVPCYLKTIPKDKTGREMKFNLERFIGNEVYKRHATPESVKRVEPKPPAYGDRKAWSIHLEQWRRFERWPAFLGPEPGFPESNVPCDMLQPGEQEEADERVMKIWNWMPEHEQTECQEGIRRIPSWLETRSKIFAAARQEPTPGMDTGRPPCGLLPRQQTI